MTNSLILVLYVVSMVSLSFCSDFLNRLRVPIYSTYSFSTGYDSNIFRLSESEMSNPFFYDEENPPVDTDTYDSAVLSPKFSVNYKPHLIKKIKTEFLFSVTGNYYSASSEKSFNIIFSEFGVRFAPYNWLKVSHRLIPSYYLRNYVDRDIASDENLMCMFSSESFLVSYSQRIKGKSWIKFRLNNTNLYYNSNFTEFDTRITQFDLRVYFKLIKLSNSVYFGIANGDNVSYNSGYASAYTDRSYMEYLWGFNSKKKLKLNMDTQAGFSLLMKNRIYSTESYQDVLHSGREHLEYNLTFWIDREINDTTDASIKFKYRLRDVSSIYSWVSDLKEFNKFELLLGISFKRASDILF